MTSDRMLLQIIIAATREGRGGHLVGAWFEEVARRHGSFDIEVADLAEVDLPLLDEPNHPRFANYRHEHTKAWSAFIDRADAYVFVTPEYDFTPPASLVNAFQHLLHEWAYKPLGFVSYGGVSAGTRSVQVTRNMAVAARMVSIPEAVHIPFYAQYLDREAGTFTPGEVQEEAAGVMLGELHKWADALAPLRAKSAAQ